MIKRLDVAGVASLLQEDPLAQWSPMGATVLAEFLCEYMPADDEIDLDAIRQEFSEHLTSTAWAVKAYGEKDAASIIWGGYWSEHNEVDKEGLITEHIRSKIMFLPFDTGIIVQNQNNQHDKHTEQKDPGLPEEA
jgi:hypothetical protein